MTRLTSLTSFVVVAVLVGGCSTSMRVRHASAPGVDLAAYDTFDWRSIPDDVDDPLLAEPELAFRLQDRVCSAFREKGYRKVDRDPDVYLVYHVALDTRLTRATVDRWGYRYPPYRRPGGWVVVDAFEVGTLAIDVVDARTDELVWRGTATDAVSSSASGRLDQLDEAVSRILAPFPARRDRGGQGPVTAADCAR